MSNCAKCHHDALPKGIQCALAIAFAGLVGLSSCVSRDAPVDPVSIGDVPDSGGDARFRDSSSNDPVDVADLGVNREAGATEARALAPPEATVDAPSVPGATTLDGDPRDARPDGEDADVRVETCPMQETACCCEGDVSEELLCMDGQLTCPDGFDLYFGADCTAIIGPCSLPVQCFDGCLSVAGQDHSEDGVAFETELSEFIGGIDRWVFDFEWSHAPAPSAPPTVLRVIVRLLRTPAYEITEDERSYEFPAEGSTPLEIFSAELAGPDIEGGRIQLQPVRGHFIVRRSGSQFIGDVELLFSSDPAAAMDPDFDTTSPSAVWGSGVFFVSA